MKRLFVLLLAFSIISFGVVSCGGDDSPVADMDQDSQDDGDQDINDGGSTAVSTPTSAFDEFNSESVTVSFDGDEITIVSTALPNHTSPYWTTDSELYIDPILASEASMSPGFIQESSYTLTVSAAPEIASSSSATGLGAIGISITGVPIYNQSEGPTDVTESTASGFDWAGGHSGPDGYHYHIEARDVSENDGVISYDDEKLVGIMADGFLLYGRREVDGSYPDDLDESGGHWGTTQHSDEPIYHYHIINEFYLSDYIILFGVDLQGTPSNIM